MVFATRREFLQSAALNVGLCATGASHRNVILERAKLLSEFPAQRLPEATPELLMQARKIAQGMVFFYGRTPVEVGLKNIDWSGSQLKHQEWPAQLNRFFHLRPLAAAYQSTREEIFAQAARAYIEDWIRGDTYATVEKLRPGDSTLNMSIRLGTSDQTGWGGTLPFFLPSPAFADEFLYKVLESIAAQAGFLSRHLTDTGNWRIAELDALVFTALRFPFLPGTDQFSRIGIVGMRNALATQFLPDGVHIERTPSYAAWMTDVAANYFRLPSLFPKVDAHVNPARLINALDYIAQSELFGVNDSTAPQRDPEVLGGLRTRDSQLRRLNLVGQTAPQPPLEQVFPDAGQVFLRSGWQPGADYIAFDASTWGGGHSHLSRLSFVFRAYGRMLVADPGILNYEMSDPLGPYGKSTPAHSTLNIGGRNQSGADAQLIRTEFTPAITLIQARYQGGYWEGSFGWNFSVGRGTGTYGDHERILLWVKGEYLIALDSMSTDAGAEIRNCWQLGPMEKWSQDEKALAWWSENGDANLWLQLIAGPKDIIMQTFEGSRAPLRGWLGVHGNDTVPAPLVEFRYRAENRSPVLSAVLFCAYRGNEPPKYVAKGDRHPLRGSIHHLELDLPDGSTDYIAWTTGLALPVDDGRPFTTDGTFIWVRSDPAGRCSRHFVLNGSYLLRNGSQVF